MEHGPVTGIILRHGYLIKEWGEPERVDMIGAGFPLLRSRPSGMQVIEGLF